MPASHSMHEMMCGHYAPFVIFGKYRGACAKCVADNDPQYARWCLAQEGLPERYPDVCGYWITAGFAPLPRCAAITQAGQSCPNRARDEEMFCGTHLRYVCSHKDGAARCAAKSETGGLCGEHFDTELYALLG